MNLRNILIGIGVFILLWFFVKDNAIYKSDAFEIYPAKVVQGNYTGKALTGDSLISDYISTGANKYSRSVSFKFSINSRDNEMVSGKDHHVVLIPENGKCESTIQFGVLSSEKQLVDDGSNLEKNTKWFVHLDMRKVFKDFMEKGYFTFFNGEKLYPEDLKGIYIAGNSAPLSWDFSNLYTRPEMELKDEDGDHIYDLTLTMNPESESKDLDKFWVPRNKLTNYPKYNSDYPLSDAIYNLSLDEMINAVEPDSTFRTGKEWAGVWTRDISYSIILSMAHMQPKVAKYSLLRKVKNNRIIQDTGTGGAYPVSTDRIVWSIAAWELYKVTGDHNWLEQAYAIIRNTLNDDIENAFDSETGLMKGESSFLDWREQTYPNWMQPADIYESECLGTNAVFYKACSIASEMASLLHKSAESHKFSLLAYTIKKGINTSLWMEDKGYYGQYLYGRNSKILSTRSEALGEALCVIFGIADKDKAASVIKNVPVTEFGIPCIYPQIPNIPPYHNNGMWPFVQSYWAWASAKAGNEKSLLTSIASIYRPAALFLTNKENLVADDGDYAGTQINSSNMLWSLSGNIALVNRILFGLEFDADSIRFNPFVPEKLKGYRSLKNIKIRNMVLEIDVNGHGNSIESFKMDDKLISGSAIAANMTGKHKISIQLKARNTVFNRIKKVSNYTSIETPFVKISKETISWKKIENAVKYAILKNGKKFYETKDLSFKINTAKFAEYQVVALDKNNVPSFASEPIAVFDPKNIIEYSLGGTKSYIETGYKLNKIIEIPIRIESYNTYILYFQYANGNGPVNTQNKCAIRSLKLDGKKIGTLVMPQRGKDEWANWGYSNSTQVVLTRGDHKISVELNPENDNMNGEINEARLSSLYLLKIN